MSDFAMNADPYRIVTAAGQGDLAALRYFHDEDPGHNRLFDADALDYACQRGQLDVVKWFWRRRIDRAFTPSAVYAATSRQQYRVLAWLVDHVPALARECRERYGIHAGSDVLRNTADGHGCFGSVTWTGNW